MDLSETRCEFIRKGTQLAKLNGAYRGRDITHWNGNLIEEMEDLVVKSNLEWVEAMLNVYEVLHE